MADEQSQPNEDELIGQTIGQYEIIRELGKGGMATVYLARQKSIGRTVAIKVIPPNFTHDATFMQRFEREVQVISKLQHPRVLPVYDYGEYNRRPYIVMAHMSGGTLADRMASGPMPLDEILRMVEQIAEGLDHAHSKGVIHRDFKPSNVLLDEHGNAHLADFGIAKISESTIQLTGTGIVGTPAYMAPEMASSARTTPQADIYALGVTLFQMLTGSYPFSGETPLSVLLAHVNEPVPDVSMIRPELSPAIAHVVNQAMAKDPENRYQTAGELASALRQAIESSGSEAVGAFDAGLTAPLTDAIPMTPPPVDTPAGPATPPPTAAVAPQPKGRRVTIGGCSIGIGLVIGGIFVLLAVCVGGFFIMGASGVFDTTPTPVPTQTPESPPQPTDTPEVDQGTTSLEIVNQGSVTICAVYVSLNSDDEWGDNRLGADEVIRTGESYTLTDIPYGKYDYIADDCGNNMLDVHAGVVFDGPWFSWVIRDRALTFTLENQTSYNICKFFVSSPDDTIWALNQMEEGQVVTPGGQFTIAIASGKWDMQAVNCDETLTWEKYEVALAADGSWMLVDGDAIQRSQGDQQ
ncbi:MAG: serine/threonine protein kinase [Anaerolineae bacterium]|nr:serine/threonine protein kinase [Anaerolineae bacterium]